MQLAILVVQNRHAGTQKVALGQDKQRKLPFKIMYEFCWSCPSVTFASQHGGFVPREWQAAKGLSANGLQKALCTLSRFCNNWMMNINIKKTKIVISQKKRRKSTTLKHQFYISKTKVEITNSYTYLGENFLQMVVLKNTKQS